MEKFKIPKGYITLTMMPCLLNKYKNKMLYSDFLKHPAPCFESFLKFHVMRPAINKWLPKKSYI